MNIPDDKKLVCGRCGEEHDKHPERGLRCTECGAYGEPSCVVPDTDGPLCDPDEHEARECFHF